MSEFRTGRFDKSRLSPFLQKFCPVRAEQSILDVDPATLAKAGKTLVLLDVDNTLLVWRSEEIPETTKAWVVKSKAAGIQLCILSNTRNPGRLDRLAKALDIPYFFGKFKPSTYMYEKALVEFKARPEQTLMIGDQIFTDVLGANRSGIEAIWVRQMAPKDFVGTKLSRLGEALLRKRLYKALIEEVEASEAGRPPQNLETDVRPLPEPGGDAVEGEEDDLAVGGTAAFDLLQHPTVRQFIKFVIIGGTSTVIDIGIYWILMFYAPHGDGLLSDHWGRQLLERWPGLFTALATKDGVVVAKLAAGPVFKVFSAGIAILNSFVWNRRWTFKIRGKEHRAVQLRKFFAIALVGMALNTVITTGLGNIIPGHEKRSLAVASAIATVVVAFWNFFGQKLWTFKK